MELCDGRMVSVQVKNNAGYEKKELRLFCAKRERIGFKEGCVQDFDGAKGGKGIGVFF